MGQRHSAPDSITAKLPPRLRKSSMIRSRRFRWPSLGLQTKLTAIITLPILGVVGVVLGLLSVLQFDQAKQAVADHAESIRQVVNQDLERLYLTQDQRLCTDLADRLQSFPEVR